MGVRKYNNQFRAAVNINGKSVQKYFEKEKEAHQFITDCKFAQGAISNNKTSKRISAKHQDLPVGLLENPYSKLRNGNQYDYNSIKATVCIGGKVISFTRNYGINRDRKDAITLCQDWRIKKLILNKE
jgi:hypothetical protein